MTAYRFFRRTRFSKHTARLPLSTKVDILIEILHPRAKNSEKIKNLIALLNRIKSVSKKRNLIGHNPLMLQIADDPEDTPSLRECIVSARATNNVITYEEAVNIADESEALEAAFHQCLAKLRGKAINVTHSIGTKD